MLTMDQGKVANEVIIHVGDLFLGINSDRHKPHVPFFACAVLSTTTVTTTKLVPFVAAEDMAILRVNEVLVVVPICQKQIPRSAREKGGAGGVALFYAV